MQVEFEGSSFSFKKIIRALFKYKWINLFILLTTLFFGVIYYYLQQPVYESTATLEISTNPKEARKDFFGNTEGSTHSTETEIDILKSEFLLNKTLHSINRSASYYKKSRFKTTVLYNDAPFILTDIVIKNKKVFGKTFIIKHIDQEKFELSYKKSLLSKLKNMIIPSKAKFDKDIFRYGEKVDLPNCTIVIEKKGLYQRAEYSFAINQYDAILQELKQNLTIKPASFKSSVLRLTYKDNIAQRAKDFLNAFLQNYLSYSKHNMVELDDRTLGFINQQIDAVSGKLEHSENALKSYKSSHNISDIEAQKKEVVAKLSKFKEQLKNAEVEFSVIKRLYSYVRDGNYNAISSLSKNYPVLDKLFENLEDTKLKREQKLVTFTEFHPDVISLSKSIADTQNSLQEIAKGIYHRVLQQVLGLKKVVAEYQNELKRLPKIEQDLVRHKRIYSVNDNVYKYLLKKQSELSIDKASTILNKKILDYAKLPMRPLSPRLGSILVTSTFLGLLLALLHTLFRAKFDTKIKDRSDIYSMTDIPIFGLIPFVQNKNMYNSAYVLDIPNSPSGEAFRAIQNNLEYAVSNGTSKVIVVTSSIPNEGKTTVAANLAAVLGMGEKKSIILSLDLRRPELHHKFKLSNKVGMSDVLSNRIDIKDVTWQNEQYVNFNIVTSGSVPPNPAELISSQKMKKIIEDLRKEYDYIILDTPPFEYVGDALSLFKYADVTLFVVKSEFSENRYLKEMENLVKRFGIKNAGIILNSVKAKHYVGKKFDYRYIYHEA